MSHTVAALMLFFVLITLGATQAGAAMPCEELRQEPLPNTMITLAETVPAGPSNPPGAANLPAYCRVQATLKPSNDSDIKMELWMPVASSWNGKFRGTGNGGLGGGAAVNTGPLANALRL